MYNQELANQYDFTSVIPGSCSRKCHQENSISCIVPKSPFKAQVERLIIGQ